MLKSGDEPVDTLPAEIRDLISDASIPLFKDGDEPSLNIAGVPVSGAVLTISNNLPVLLVLIPVPPVRVTALPSAIVC